VASFFELGEPENTALTRLLKSQRQTLLEYDSAITGFNVGVNDGVSAGQTVMHCHIHLIPRRDGDTSDPRGGVRGVIPDKQKY
jgi:diadenosine tetraphosphate (Ap4A) HIT family hydrolase